jgi:hypothetical protein
MREVPLYHPYCPGPQSPARPPSISRASFGDPAEPAMESKRKNDRAREKERAKERARARERASESEISIMKRLRQSSPHARGTVLGQSRMYE